MNIFFSFIQQILISGFLLGALWIGFIATTATQLEHRESINFVLILIIDIVTVLLFIIANYITFLDLKSNTKNKFLYFLYLILFISIAGIFTASIVRNINIVNKNNSYANREEILISLNSNFTEPRLIKDVGITKYRDFYLITDKNEILAPFAKHPAYATHPVDILSDSEKLLNLKKLIGQNIKINIIGTKKYPYEFFLKGRNYRDNSPLTGNKYYLVEISENNLYLDLNNFKFCTLDCKIDKFCCSREIYHQQRYMNY